jgi:hypothetical protein
LRALTLEISAAGTGIQTHFEVLYTSPDNANTFAAILQAGLLYQRYQVANSNPDLAASLSQAEVAPWGDSLDVTLPLTDDQVVGMIQLNTFANHPWADDLRLRRRIIGQKLDSDSRVAHWNNASLLHALDSQVNLSLAEATGRIDDRISLEAVGQSGDGWEREKDLSGTACYDEVLAAGRHYRLDDAFLVLSVDGGAFDALYAAQNFGDLGDERAPHFLDGRGYGDGNF